MMCKYLRARRGHDSRRIDRPGDRYDNRPRDR